jgi:arylsulfatase A-like enzyme
MISRNSAFRFSLLTAIATACLAGNAARLEARQPNVIIIFTDDQGYRDIGCFGATGFTTPNLDRMAAEGRKFTDFHVLAAVCTPSRAALMTGCYPKRVGMTKVLFPRDDIGLNPNEVTVAEVLKSRGYATMCIGKWHLGHHARFLPVNQGFDEYFGIPYSNDMGMTQGSGELRTDGKNPPLPLLQNENIVESEPDQSQLTRRYTEQAIQFIKTNRGKPFFLYLPHTFPHSPWFASNAFRGKSDHGLYGDMIEEIDWSTGEILDTLRELGLEKDTLVIFTSDNGPALRKDGVPCGSALPLRGGKFSSYEGGDREPCIMWWPETIPAGTTCAELVSAMDVLPTVAAIAGAELPADRIIDGHDIGPLIRGEPGSKSPYDFFCRFRGANLIAVRQGPWRLYLAKGKQSAELYNLEKDISETQNVAAEYPEVVQRLAELGRQRDEAISNNVRPVGTLDN